MGSQPFAVYSDVRAWRGTCAEIDRRARAVAASLRSNGVGPGDVVAMQLPNWAEAAVTFWAAAYLGAVIVPIVHFYGAKEVDYILRTVLPDVVVTPDRFGSRDYLGTYESLLAGYPQSRWLIVADTAPSRLPSRAIAMESLYDADPVTGPATVDPDLPAVIGFTSGTTSDPKGVVHSHRTIAAEIGQTSRRLSMDIPAMLVGAPVGHFTGMLGAFLRPLVRDTSIHLVDVWDPGEILRLMMQERLAVGGGATYFLTSLLDHPDWTDDHLRFVPVCGLGGSAVPVAIAERAARLGIKVFRSYGSTEHPSVTASSTAAPEGKRLQTDGRPLPGVEIQVDDDGQIWTRGPDLFMGYTDPQLTASVFDADGWYRTGDVGTIEDGYLTVTDRVSDVIIRGGENISAPEVEDLLLRLDVIAEVAVVSEPDARLGEHAAAVLTTREGCSAPTLDLVRSHLADAGLARQKWPEALYHVRDLPRTPSGKIQKFRLREQLRTGELEEKCDEH